MAESDPRVSLHGGPKGFDDVDWDVIHPMEATLFGDKEKISIGSIPAAVVFRHTSPDGDQGFPGTLLIEVLVGLINPGQSAPETIQGEYHLGSILFVYRAKLLDEKKATPINLTQVSGSGRTPLIFSMRKLNINSTGASIWKLVYKAMHQRSSSRTTNSR